MIANGRFEEPGAAPGEAAGWVLRSVCQAERIAPFGPAPATGSESFERWHPWSILFTHGTLALAVFSGGVAVERFDWPIAALRLELSGGAVAGTMREAFVWTSAPFASAWTEIASMGASFAGSAREAFEIGWRGADGFLAQFPDAALARAAFHGAPSEAFEAAWSPNPTLR